MIEPLPPGTRFATARNQFEQTQTTAALLAFRFNAVRCCGALHRVICGHIIGAGSARTDNRARFLSWSGLSEAGLQGEESARTASIDEVTSLAKDEMHRRIGVVLPCLLPGGRDFHAVQFSSHDNSDDEVGVAIQIGSNKERVSITLSGAAWARFAL